MTGSLRLLHEYSSTSSYPDVRVADGSYVSVRGIGTVPLTPTLTISSVLYLHNLSFNLLSVSALTQTHHYHVLFCASSCEIQDLSTETLLGRGRRTSDGLYILDVHSPSLACSGVSSTIIDLHNRLGHPSLSSLKRLCPETRSVSQLFCESCQLAKHHRATYLSRNNTRASTPFELVHSDIWRPCPIQSRVGFRYFVTFVDDYSRMTWLYLLRSCDELFSVFSAFYAEIHTQFSLPIRMLRSDNAREYFSSHFTAFMTQHGIIHQSSCPDTPPQNGVAERKNRHLLEATRALMFQTGMPKLFWSEAVLTAVYLINRMSSFVLQEEIPFRVLFPHQPLHPLPLRIFGCTCYVRDIRPDLSKLDPRSLYCIFLGYSRTQKEYQCYSPNLRRFCISADVVFDETTPFTSSYPSPRAPSDSSSVDDILVYELVPAAPVPPPISPPVSSPAPSSSDLPVPMPLQVYTRGHHPVISWGSPAAPTPPLNSPAPAPIPMDSPVPTPPVSLESSHDSPSSNLDVPIALRKSHRSCSTYPMAAHISYAGVSPRLQAFISALDSISIPRSLSEALSSPGWKQAMVEEMGALEANQT
ncbi:hypothetical protein Dimus_038193 [Dionaea muscipula]